MTITSLIVGGDTHGDKKQISYFFHNAKFRKADAILIVGDFGYWEHEKKGIAFLDFIERQFQATGIPLYWLDGNHENHTMLRANYGKEKTDDGFWIIRDGCYYAPRGHRWTWNERHCMSLGGAASTDKDYRLARERGEPAPRWGIFSWETPMGPGTMWWPEEELTDAEVGYALRNPNRLDVLFTHDKPRASNVPGIDRKAKPECYPNQDQVTRVMKALRPKLLIHGHLHVRYTEQIICADNSYTTVVGLGCETTLPKTDSWVYLDLQPPASTDVSRDTPMALAGVSHAE